MRLREKGISSRLIDGELVVLDVEQSKYLSFGGSAVVLFERLQQDCEPEDLVAALVSAYHIDAATAQADVAEFLESLARTGLLLEPGRAEA